MKRVEIQLRINELAEKLESGMSISDMYALYLPKWDIAERTLRYYLSFAKDIVAGRLKNREAVLEAGRAEIIDKEIEKMKSGLEFEANLCEFADLGLKKIMEDIRDGKQGTKSNVSAWEVILALKEILKLRGTYSRGIQEKETEDKAAKFIAADETTATFLKGVEDECTKYENEVKNEEILPPPPTP